MAFRWINNNNGTGTGPAFMIDDISLTAAATASACMAVDSVTVTTPGPTGPIGIWTWVGGISDDWFNPCNWDKLSVPDTLSRVVVPGSTLFNPVVRADTGYCKDITVFHINGGHVTYDYGSGGKLIKKP